MNNGFSLLGRVVTNNCNSICSGSHWNPTRKKTHRMMKWTAGSSEKIQETGRMRTSGSFDIGEYTTQLYHS